MELQDDSIVGATLDDKYVVEERLGHGGMGAVYLARHLGTGRLVALKVIMPELTADDAAVERFRREARAAGKLRHPNVVNVTDFGFAYAGDQKVAYLVMERLRGETLADLLERKKVLSLDRAVDILQQVCCAVSEAHRHGIVHRDLKPENVWLEPQGAHGCVVKVLDFGVAKLRDGHPGDPAREGFDELRLLSVDPDAPTAPGPLSDPGSNGPPSNATLASSPVSSRSGARVRRPADDGITDSGILLGTPYYMSPEQWMQGRVDERSDVYSLGILTFRMLAGEVPFDGRAAPIASQHLRAQPPSLAEKVPGLPRGVVSLVSAALSKAPAQRPASAESFAAALSAASEPPGETVVRAISLTARNFSKFFAVNTRVFGPAILACALRLASRVMVDAHVLPTGIGAVVNAFCLVVYLLSMILLQPVAQAFYAPIVRDALLNDLEPPRPAPTRKRIIEVFQATLVPSLTVFGALVATSSLLRQPLVLVVQHFGLSRDDALDFGPLDMLVAFFAEMIPVTVFIGLMGRFTAFPSVVTMEGARGIGAMRRSAALTKPLRRQAILFLALHFNLAIAIMWVFRLALAQLAKVSFLIVFNSMENTTIAVLSMLLNLGIQVLVWTFTFTTIALYYLKARQMEGVPLEALAEEGDGDGGGGPSGRRFDSNRPPAKVSTPPPSAPSRPSLSPASDAPPKAAGDWTGRRDR